MGFCVSVNLKICAKFVCVYMFLGSGSMIFTGVSKGSQTSQELKTSCSRGSPSYFWNIPTLGSPSCFEHEYTDPHPIPPFQ